MAKPDFKTLLQKFRSGECTPEELDFLESWYFKYYDIDATELSESELIREVDLLSGNIKGFVPEEVLAAAPTVAKHRKLWYRVAAAAVILIITGLFFYQNHRKQNVNGQSVYANDIAPGKTGATLTLANGKKIRLADAANGEIAKEAGISVTKTAYGQLIYEIKENAGETGKINTLSTAKGETYMLTLPDKSTVWLNAASSLTYAATLHERGEHSVRRVKLEGEAYFQIAKDKAHPFIVESRGQQVEVLGTHFNVSAYGDDADIKTTLLEGSVKVNENTVLKPGQQAVLRDQKLRVQQVNTEDAVAWKNGLFVFEDEPLQSVMRKVSRWYDVEVVYGDVDRNKSFYGGVSRFDNISKLLKVMESTKGVHFKLEGRRLTVMK